jgi:Tol biopolymer transport system component
MQGCISPGKYFLFFGMGLLSFHAARACQIENAQTSADGRWIAFESSSADCVGGSNGPQVYVKDTQKNRTIVISASSSGVVGSGFSHFPRISADGGFVTFQSNSPNLLANGDNVYRVFRKDIADGSIRVVSTSEAGVLANNASFNGSLSGNGRYLFFESVASNLIPGVAGYHIYRKDLGLGDLVLVSADEKDFPLNSSNGKPSSSDDGTGVAFISGNQVYFKNLVTRALSAVSVDADGTAGNAFNTGPEVESDTAWVSFRSGATNFRGFPNPGAFLRKYRKNRVTGELQLVSKAAL